MVRNVGEGTDGQEAVGQAEGRIRKLIDPRLPSAKEVEEHNITHIPYRNWCPHCVKGRGKEMSHRKDDDDGNRGIDEFHFDYCFPGDEFGFRLTVLVGVERYTGMKMAVVVPTKGADGSYAARRAAELMTECGNRDTEVIIKTDQ